MSIFDQPRPVTLTDLDALADLALLASVAPNLPKAKRDYYDRVASKTIELRAQMYRADKD